MNRLDLLVEYESDIEGYKIAIEDKYLSLIYNGNISIRKSYDEYKKKFKKINKIYNEAIGIDSKLIMATQIKRLLSLKAKELGIVSEDLEVKSHK